MRSSGLTEIIACAFSLIRVITVPVEATFSEVVAVSSSVSLIAAVEIVDAVIPLKTLAALITLDRLFM